MSEVSGIDLAWRGPLADGEVVALTLSHGGRAEPRWWDRVRSHSLGWTTARATGGVLVGFANVAWDGGVHAFLLDPKVRPDYQRRGIGTAMVGKAAERAGSLGCEWLHVDFHDVERLGAFYFGSCGFTPTTAGLIRLTASDLERATERYA